MLGSDRNNTRQKAFRIRVTDEEDRLCWDSGVRRSDCSLGTEYEGTELTPYMSYQVKVWIQDNYGREAIFDTYFETGFLDETGNAWEGAVWIAAPRYTVSARNRGVFSIESTFRLKEGSRRGGIVFGANDERLLDCWKNELGLQGENYIRFEICLDGVGKLDIYRVGYAPEDQKDIPFASIPLVDRVRKEPLLTGENRYDFHTLRIDVDGNTAWTYLDDLLVDAVEQKTPWGMETKGRTLNPRGDRDVLTYPRLNEIGFFAGPGDTVYFRNLQVRNLRQPGNLFLRETPEGNLYGEPSLFRDAVKTEDQCFVLCGEQVVRNPSGTGLPMMRKTVEIRRESRIKKARLYMTARGIYACMVNGASVTEQLLPPGLTQYDRRITYQTYNVTELLRPGGNAIGVTLAPGWWSDAQTFTVKNYNYFGDQEALLAKLVVTYEDGIRQVEVSDPLQWKYSGEGPYRYAGFFAGEEYDASRTWIYDRYSLPDFDDADWEQPREYQPVPIESSEVFPHGFGREWPAVNEKEPVYEGGFDAPIYIVERRCAKSRSLLGKGICIYDLEQEMAGVPRITFHEKAGTKITIRYGEMLYPHLKEYGENAGRLLLENYRDATSTDLYICSGEENGETYQPRFTFHGYRYIELSGITHIPELEEVESLQYSSVTDYQGEFRCSDSLPERFAENVRWSQLCNFINIPTDCPQRNERMGWAGDTHVFCHTALLNSNLKLFYERNLQAMADLQTEEGRYPEIAPIGGGFGGITYECATIFIAWELYQQYGDQRTLKRFYPGMKKYMEYMRNKGMPGEGEFRYVGPLGDWLAPEETDLQLLWNAFYYREADLMGKIAGLLGESENQKKYENLASEIKTYWNQTFIDPVTGKTRGLSGEICDTQTSYALGLEYQIIKDRKKAGTFLEEKVRKSNYTVQTGFFGTGLLNAALCDVGATEAAYRLILQKEYPSWLYPVTQGATTIWERWDSYTREKGFGGQNSMNSFNHYSLGSVLSWMYEDILGIQREEAYPGYSRFTLCPVIGNLEYAYGKIATPQGIIESGWEKKKDQLIYSCRIPENARAMVVLPGGVRKELGSGSYTFSVKNG